MKKRLISFIVSVLLVFSFAVPTMAVSPLLVDNAGLLYEDEYLYVADLLEKASEEHEASFVIVTVNGTEGKSMMEYADDYFDYGGYRYDGILLLIDMEMGEYWFSTCGKYDTYEVNTEVLDVIETDVYENLAQGDFYGAFTAFANDCSEIDELDFYESEDLSFDPAATLFISLIIGVVTAFIVTMSMKAQLKTVRRETRAANYIINGSIKVTESVDLFLYHHITRTPRPKSNSSGSSHRSSSGRSHGGRGGSFR